MEVFSSFSELCKTIGHKKGECRSSRSVPNPIFSLKPSFLVKNVYVDVDNVDDDAALWDVVTPKLLNLSIKGNDPIIKGITCLAASEHVPEFNLELSPIVHVTAHTICVSLASLIIKLALVDSMVGVESVALGPRLCVSAGGAVNCDVNSISVLSCANFVPARCGLPMVEIPSTVGELFGFVSPIIESLVCAAPSPLSPVVQDASSSSVKTTLAEVPAEIIDQHVLRSFEGRVGNASFVDIPIYYV